MVLHKLCVDGWIIQALFSSNSFVVENAKYYLGTIFFLLNFYLSGELCILNENIMSCFCRKFQLYSRYIYTYGVYYNYERYFFSVNGWKDVFSSSVFVVIWSVGSFFHFTVREYIFGFTVIYTMFVRLFLPPIVLKVY